MKFEEIRVFVLEFKHEILMKRSKQMETQAWGSEKELDFRVMSRQIGNGQSLRDRQVRSPREVIQWKKDRISKTTQSEGRRNKLQVVKIKKEYGHRSKKINKKTKGK